MNLYDQCESRKPLSGHLVWFLSWVAVTVIAVFLKPNPSLHGTHTQLNLPACPSVVLFHRPCPGCGLTTSWTAFVHGNFGLSFQAHPLGPFLYMTFTVLALLSGFGWWKRWRLRTDSRPANWITIGCMVLVLGFGVYRFSAVKYNESMPPLADLFSTANSEKGRQTARMPKQDASRQLPATSKIQ